MLPVAVCIAQKPRYVHEDLVPRILAKANTFKGIEHGNIQKATAETYYEATIFKERIETFA